MTIAEIEAIITLAKPMVQAGVEFYNWVEQEIELSHQKGHLTEEQREDIDRQTKQSRADWDKAVAAAKE